MRINSSLRELCRCYGISLSDSPSVEETLNALPSILAALRANQTKHDESRRLILKKSVAMNSMASAFIPNEGLERSETIERTDDAKEPVNFANVFPW